MNPDSETIGEDFLDFKCPHCAALNSFPTSAANLVRECAFCQEAFLVPKADNESASKIPLPFQRDNIVLRPFRATDWKDLLDLGFTDEDDATSWLHDISKVRITHLRKIFYLAAETPENEKVIGCVGVEFTDAEFNQISISSGNVARPYGMELELAVNQAVLDFCFRGLGVHRVQAWCRATESDTRHLLVKSGMRQEAEFIKCERNEKGEWINTLWFALLREEYFAEAGSKKTS